MKLGKLIEELLEIKEHGFDDKTEVLCLENNRAIPCDFSLTYDNNKIYIEL